MPAANATSHFSDRVENYVKYRPHYPGELFEYLRERTGLTSNWIVADIGAGTGISSEMFLAAGMTVHGVEPNAPMREAGERYLSSYQNYHAIDATAEATTLADRSVDLIVAGQAFHWFDRTECAKEFKCILKPKGYIAIVWNDRQTDSTPFLRHYEALLQEFGTDYNEINHTNLTVATMSQFFSGNYLLKTFQNTQPVDFESAKGRLLSSSYVPAPGDSGHDEMLVKLKEIFDADSTDGSAQFEYETQLFLGRL